MAIELVVLGEVEKLAVAPWDTVIITVDMYIDSETAERLGSTFKEKTGLKNKVVVLGRGIEVSVLHPCQNESLEKPAGS